MKWLKIQYLQGVIQKPVFTMIMECARKATSVSKKANVHQLKVRLTITKMVHLRKIGGIEKMGKSIYLSEKELDFLSRVLGGLIVDENHADFEVCEKLMSKIES